MNKVVPQPSAPDPGAQASALIRDALDVAAQSPSIQFSAKLGKATHAAARDGQPTRLVVDLNGAVQRYCVEASTRIRGLAGLDTIARRPPSTVDPILLVVPHMISMLAEACMQRDLQFIDLAGNMYLHPPGQHVFIIGRSPNAEIKRLKRTAGQSAASASASALRMIFVILCDPSFVNRPYRDIAAAAGIALGTVGAVFEDLRERRLLTGLDSGHGRRLLDVDGLRDEWVTGYPLRLLPKLNVQRFSAVEPSWWEAAEIPAGRAWWGGEVAANRLTGQLHPVTQTLYVRPIDRKDLVFQIVRHQRLRADPTGPIEVLDAFWDLGAPIGNETTAPLLLIYADLMRTRDPRNVQTAALVREQME